MDHFDVQEKIMKLRVTIRQQQQQLETLQDEVKRLRSQLAPIQARYDRIVRPIADRVEALREAVRELEALRRRQARGASTPMETLWQEDRWRNDSHTQDQDPPPEMVIPKTRPTATEDIKKVYRRLARRHHPDLAEGNEERLQRNHLMAKINGAYAERDLEALLALDDTSEDETPQVDVPLAVLKLRRLQMESAELLERLEDLKIEKFDLTHSVLFDLKIQEKWDKRLGKKPLEEMATWLEREYERLSIRLHQLRQSMQ